MKLYEYSANNSGGGDWLTADNWSALEKAGWKLFGFGDFVYDNGCYVYEIDGLPKRLQKSDRIQYAFKFFDTIEDAIEEFERVAEQNYEDEGCECCGSPHSISEV